MTDPGHQMSPDVTRKIQGPRNSAADAFCAPELGRASPPPWLPAPQPIHRVLPTDRYGPSVSAVMVILCYSSSAVMVLLPDQPSIPSWFLLMFLSSVSFSSILFIIKITELTLLIAIVILITIMSWSRKNLINPACPCIYIYIYTYTYFDDCPDSVVLITVMMI